MVDTDVRVIALDQAIRMMPPLDQVVPTAEKFYNFLTAGSSE